MSRNQVRKWEAIQNEAKELMGENISDNGLDKLRTLPDAIDILRQEIGNGQSAEQGIDYLYNTLEDIRQNNILGENENITPMQELVDNSEMYQTLEQNLVDWIYDRTRSLQYVVDGHVYGYDLTREGKLLPGTTESDALILKTLYDTSNVDFGLPARMEDEREDYSRSDWSERRQSEWTSIRGDIEDLFGRNFSDSEKELLYRIGTNTTKIKMKLSENNDDIIEEMNMIQSDILRINYNSNPNANRDFI
jgi:hypothetical protein